MLAVKVMTCASGARLKADVTSGAVARLLGMGGHSEVLSVLVSLLTKWAPELVRRMTDTVMEHHAFASVHARPALRSEVQATAKVGVYTYLAVLAGEQGLGPVEKRKLAAFSNRGIHATLSVDAIIEAYRSAAFECLVHIIDKLVAEQPLITGKVMATILHPAMTQLDAVVDGIRLYHPDPTSIRLSAGVALDRVAQRVHNRMLTSSKLGAPPWPVTGWVLRLDPSTPSVAALAS